MSKTLSYIGLCRKAGKLVPGTQLATEAVRAGKAVMCVLSCDASDNTAKRIKDSCSYHGVGCVVLRSTSEELGSALGRESIAAAAVTDPGFAEMIKRSL